MSPVQFFSGTALNALAWSLFALIPLGIVLLYFLKLRRQPLEVPSTYLWSRTIEDLHVNSLWQRLRQSLLLFLQLLLLLLLLLACFRPSWRGSQLIGDRFVFLVDTSASMTATDAQPTRLDEAKRQVETLIDQMQSGDVAMIVSFSDTPRVEQPFTDNRRLLQRQLKLIQPTHRTSNLLGALQVAAGLANPGRSGERNSNDIAVADALPATAYIFSDGRVPRISKFTLGNLDPVYVPIGSDQCHNIGIVAFSAQRNPEKPDRLQVFGRLQHFDEDASDDNDGADDEGSSRVEVALYLDGDLIDASQVDVPHSGFGGLKFDLQDLNQGTLMLSIEDADDFQVDNLAYTAINLPLPAKVLLVTPGNEALLMALGTTQAIGLADTVIAEPDLLQTGVYRKNAAGGKYDLIIYDQCAPDEMPQANTLFIGRAPPVGWQVEEAQAVPQIIDTDHAHPLMQFVEMGNVTIAEATPLKPPAGSTVLADSDVGPIFAIGPRAGYEDAVMGFSIVDIAAGEVNTDWHIRLSFPLFVANALRYLGGGSTQTVGRTLKPGTPVPIRSETAVSALDVENPRGDRVRVTRDGLGRYTFSETDQIGVYNVYAEDSDDASKQFSVNLFDANESNINPAVQLDIGYAAVQGQATWEPTRRDGWKYLLFAALGVLLAEWYIFNRRVYL